MFWWTQRLVIYCSISPKDPATQITDFLGLVKTVLRHHQTNLWGVLFGVDFMAATFIMKFENVCKLASYGCQNFILIWSLLGVAKFCRALWKGDTKSGGLISQRSYIKYDDFSTENEICFPIHALVSVSFSSSSSTQTDSKSKNAILTRKFFSSVYAFSEASNFSNSVSRS